MAWRFRKRFRLGPIRYWLSRSGVGFSWGFPGFRLGVSASGQRYFSIGIPGSGLYYIKYLRAKPPKQILATTPQVPAVSGKLGSGQRLTAPSPGAAPSVQPWWRQKNLP